MSTLLRAALLSLALGLSLVGAPPAGGQAASPDVDPPIVAAVRAEIERAGKSLTLEGNPPPYFISVAIVEEWRLHIAARNGALVRSHQNHGRSGVLDLRVGAYELDQTNFAAGDSFGMAEMAHHFTVSLESDPFAVRRQLWLAMDEAYKKALETLKSKKAFLETQIVKDLPADLTREDPVRHLAPLPRDLPDRGAWEETLRSLSRAFSERAGIDRSEVSFEAALSHTYLVTSEGTVVSYPTSFAMIEVDARAQADDGREIREYRQYPASSERALPAAAELSREIASLAEDLIHRKSAPEIGNERAPVLFQGQAAAQVFGQILADHLGTPRSPLSGGDERMRAMMEPLSAAANPLAPFFNRAVLPEAFSIVDDPTLEEFQGQALHGASRFDHQGVPAQRVQVVEKGKLTGFLQSRTPTPYSTRSNGHARLSMSGAPRGAMTNLIVEAGGGIPGVELLRALRELSRKRGVPYGYLITRITPGAKIEMDTAGMQALFMNLMGGGKSEGVPLGAPLTVYRVDAATGGRTLVRDAVFSGGGLEHLEEIAAFSREVSAHPYVVSEGFLQMQKPLGLGSIVCPDILVDKVRFKEGARHNQARPYLKNPLDRE